MIALTVLGALIALYAIANHFWLAEGASLYGRDVVGHLQLAAKFHSRILDTLHDTSSSAGRRFLDIFSLFHEWGLPFHHTYIWPKLTHLTTATACLAFGLSRDVMIHCNILFFAVLILSVYLTGRYCHSAKTGLLAAVLVSLYPAVYGQSRKFGLDFPLTAMTALSIYALLRAENFQRRSWTVLLGLILGLGILTKGQIVFYAGAPILFCAAAAVARRETRTASSLLNILLFAIIALAVSAPWWWGVTIELWRAYFATVTDYPFSWAYAYKHQPPFTMRWLLFHAVHCAISVSPFFFVVFLAAIPGFVRGGCRRRLVIAAWVIGPYAIWTLSNIKRDTDFFPCLPAVALMTAAGLMSWKRTVARRGAVAACVAVGLLQFFCVSFSPAGYGFWTVDNPYDKPVEPDGYNTPFHPPYANNYEEIMARVAEKIRSDGPSEKYARIGFVETDGTERWREYSTAVLEYYLRLDTRGGLIYRSRFTPEAFLQHALSFDYLIVLDGRDSATPDWRELKEFFGEARWEKPILAYFGSREAFDRVVDSYGEYTLLEHLTMLPEKRGVFLCEKGPVPVSPGTEVPAGAYSLSDLITTPGLIGAENVPRLPPRIAEYDAFFPFWLKHPLVDGDLRYRGDPFFCEYDLDLPAGGVWRISARYASAGGRPVSVLWDGHTIAPDAMDASTGGHGEKHLEWREIASVTTSPGRHVLRLEASPTFPLLAAIRLDGP